MCFFNQYIYQCGDYKWGNFRQHCAKEYRIGETCGIKLVMENISIHTKCKICEKLEIKYNRIAKEEDRIRRWMREGGKRRSAPIKASGDIIEGLSGDITRLNQELRDRQNSLGGCATEVHKEGVALPVYRPRIATCVPGIIDRPTRHQPSDSEIKHVSEGSFSSTEALLPREMHSLPNPWTKGISVNVKSIEKMASFNSANQSADDQSSLSESPKSVAEVLGDSLLGRHAGIKCNRQGAVIPDASQVGKISFSHPKASGMETEFGEGGGNGLETKDLTAFTTIEKDAYDSKHMKEHGKRAHLNPIDKSSATCAQPNIQENARHHLKYLPTCGNLAFPTLMHGPALEFQGLPEFPDKVLEIPRSFQFPWLSSAERPMLQGLNDARRSRNGCPNPWIEITPRRPSLPLLSVLNPVPHNLNPVHHDLNPVHHDLKLKLNSTINLIVLLVKQGVFDYLMQDFYVFFDQSWAINLKSCPGSPDSSSGSDETSVNPTVDSNTSEASTGGKKRKSGKPDEDKPEQRGNDDPKRPRLDLEMGSNRFACPYFKRDPSRFGAGTQYYHHGCAGQGWKDLAKLKEHLYRAHHSFFQCPRCKIKLRSQAGLNEHSEADDICESRARGLEDGFDLETYLHLHNKRKTCKGQTDAERWKEVFSRLFPDQPVPSPYVVVFETGNTEVSATSELADMENFEAYRRREMPKSFANRATIEALRFSEPITKQLLSQVPDMIRDSEEDISRQYQLALPRADPSQFNVYQHSILPSHQEVPLSTQPTAPALNCEALNSIDKHNLLGSQQSSNFPGMKRTTTSNNLCPSPPMLGLDSGQSRLCFCNGDCTCPSTFPGLISTKDSPTEDISLVLHLVQNISNRISTLEQQCKGYAGHLDGLFSSSSFNEPTLMRSGLSSSMSQDYIGENAEKLDTVPQAQNSSTAILRPLNGPFTSADTSNDSLDWETLLNMEHSEEHSF